MSGLCPKYSQDRFKTPASYPSQFRTDIRIFNDSLGTIDQLLEENKKRKTLSFNLPIIRELFTGLWRIKEPKVIDQIRRILNPRTLIIADGHHRYETSAHVSEEERRKELQDPGRKYRRITWWWLLVNMKNPADFLILPTHRLVHNLPEERVRDFFTKCQGLLYS